MSTWRAPLHTYMYNHHQHCMCIIHYMHTCGIVCMYAIALHSYVTYGESEIVHVIKIVSLVSDHVDEALSQSGPKLWQLINRCRPEQDKTWVGVDLVYCRNWVAPLTLHNMCAYQYHYINTCIASQWLVRLLQPWYMIMLSPERSAVINTLYSWEIRKW